MAIIDIREGTAMRSVNIAELKNRLSRYLTFAKGGEEIIIRDRNLPVAKLVPFSGDEGSEDELLLVAAGKMRLPKTPVRVEELLRIPTGKVGARFFFQAEDGIRDRDVTGVQTCALPVFDFSMPPYSFRLEKSSGFCHPGAFQLALASL